MQITGKQWRTLTEALNQFPLAKLDQMLMFELEQDREAIALGNDKTDIVFRVIEHYNFRDQVEKLVLAARHYVPSNRQLQIIAQEFNVATQIEQVKRDASGGEGDSSAIAPMRLERTVRRMNPTLDVGVWVKGLLAMEPRICRIENADKPGKGVGTGFLVGEDAILTNYHVVESFLNDGKLGENRLRVRFDYSIAPDGVSLPEGVTYSVIEMVDSSPYSRVDKIPGSREEPKPDELDYALLLVDGTPASDPIGGTIKGGGDPRGVVPFPTDAYAFKNDAPLMIYQHPEGGPMKLAIETNAIESLNGSRTRVLYRTNTKSGSSGSPCFDMEWNLVALHHAGTFGSGGIVNRGIPIDTIFSLLQKRNMDMYLGN